MFHSPTQVLVVLFDKDTLFYACIVYTILMVHMSIDKAIRSLILNFVDDVWDHQYWIQV
jgi:hypothetical protein